MSFDGAWTLAVSASTSSSRCVSQDIDPLDDAAVDQAMEAFDKLRRPGTYNPLIAEITSGLAATDAPTFERALVRLGKVAGASSSVGDEKATATPDASWDFSGVLWITWEAKSNSGATGEIDVSCIDQTKPPSALDVRQDRTGHPLRIGLDSHYPADGVPSRVAGRHGGPLLLGRPHIRTGPRGQARPSVANHQDVACARLRGGAEAPGNHRSVPEPEGAADSVARRNSAHPRAHRVAIWPMLHYQVTSRSSRLTT